MARVHERIDERLRAWLLAQPVFFVATAPLAADGHVNLSPKGLAGTFAVIDERRVAYLDLTGSGVETIAHVRENGRIVVMFCAFDGPPRIVRLHGTGSVHRVGAASFDALAPLFPAAPALPGVRSIIEVDAHTISDSCGFGVPRMAFVSDRDELPKWAERKGDEKIATYHAEKNAFSLDGLPGMPEP